MVANCLHALAITLACDQYVAKYVQESKVVKLLLGIGMVTDTDLREMSLVTYESKGVKLLLGIGMVTDTDLHSYWEMSVVTYESKGVKLLLRNWYGY